MFEHADEFFFMCGSLRLTSSIKGWWSVSSLCRSWRSITCSTVLREVLWRTWRSSPEPGSLCSRWPSVSLAPPPGCSCIWGTSCFSQTHVVIVFFVFFSAEEFEFVLGLEDKAPLWGFWSSSSTSVRSYLLSLKYLISVSWPHNTIQSFFSILASIYSTSFFFWTWKNKSAILQKMDSSNVKDFSG